MTLKSACKTAIVLISVSFTLLVFGQVFSVLMMFCQKTASHNGWTATPPTQHLSLFFMWMLHSFWYLLYPALLIAGFITLLSGCLKKQDDPQANVKTRYIVAAVLTGIATLVMAWRSVGFAWITLRHSPHFDFRFGLILCVQLIAFLCAISLCAFAAINTRKSPVRTPAVLAVVCHWLLAFLMVISIGNALLVMDSPQHLGRLFPVFWLAYSIASYTGNFLRLAAVLIFLTVWLQQLGTTKQLNNN